MRLVLTDLPPSAFPEQLAGLVCLPRVYINRPENFRGRSVRVINLSRDSVYLGIGYYASLLAEARGQKVMPSSRTILDLDRKALYRHALPELDALLTKRLAQLGEPLAEPLRLLIAFGIVDDIRFRDLGRAVFDRFRHPLLSLSVRRGRDGQFRIATIKPLTPERLRGWEVEWFNDVLAVYLRVPWRAQAAKPAPRYSFAILHDPHEALPPSSPAALRKFVRVGAQMGIEVELIRKTDFLRLAEFDALLIRETTTLADHTYRFARKAEREGMPVIDDPSSILRCTNKVYLAELLAAHGLPTPKTLVLDRQHLKGVGAALGFPIVLKVPDGSFSRGVVRVNDEAELKATARKLLDDSDLILAQEFVPTKFDWRVTVLNGEPLFACQYFMSKNHWQIVKHSSDGRFQQGGWQTHAVETAPPAVVELGRRAACLIGDGLYGVDIKETDRGLMVIEINDNPNIDEGVEDEVLKDELYRRILSELVRRLERQRNGHRNQRP
jgi:glutathione synthase/RimK-type ligase-like ATP-grasp enzyme